MSDRLDKESKNHKEAEDGTQSILPELPSEVVVATSMITTAGGDGLSFMLGTPNIFDLVEALKYGKDLLEGPQNKN